MTTPASVPGTFRPAALPARIVAVVLAFALLAPTLGPAAGYELLAWMPAHGHASLGPVKEHNHAWDADASAGHSHEAAPADEGAAAVVFTPDDATGGAVLPVLIAGALVPARALAVLVAASTGRGQAQASVTPDSPPPR